MSTISGWFRIALEAGEVRSTRRRICSRFARFPRRRAWRSGLASEKVVPVDLPPWQSAGGPNDVKGPLNLSDVRFLNRSGLDDRTLRAEAFRDFRRTDRRGVGVGLPPTGIFFQLLTYSIGRSAPESDAGFGIGFGDFPFQRASACSDSWLRVPHRQPGCQEVTGGKDAPFGIQRPTRASDRRRESPVSKSKNPPDRRASSQARNLRDLRYPSMSFCWEVRNNVARQTPTLVREGKCPPQEEGERQNAE